MGFLRKVGRKIKKGAKKLFSSPIGSILGSMAINFMFPGIGQTFNKVFKGATEALGFGAKEAVKEVGKEAVKEVGKEVVKEAGKEAVKEVGKEAVKEIGKETLIQGTKIQDVLNANDLVNTASTSGTTLTETMKKNFIDRPIQAGKDFIDAPFKTTKEFISPDGEFIPDVARSLTTSSLLGAFQGEPDEPFYSKGVSQQLSSVPSQSQVLSTVNSQVPQLNIKSFEQMNQSLYYGVLSPQWLANYNINK
tara:strand:+ start:308 stop:1054 length:747 start_codon:yes stop_codon:yes gene_type:complete